MVQTQKLTDVITVSWAFFNAVELLRHLLDVRICILVIVSRQQGD